MNKIIILVVFVFCGLINAQSYQQIKFNNKIDCSSGCQYTDGSNWVGGVAPISPQQMAVFDYSTSISRVPQYIDISSSIAVGAINVTSNIVAKLIVNVQAPLLKVQEIILSYAEMDVAQGGNIIVNQLTTVGSTFNNQGEFTIQDATILRSIFNVSAQLDINGHVEISASTFTATGNVTVNPSGSISLITGSVFTSTTSATTPYLPNVSFFGQIATDMGTTFVIEQAYTVTVNSSNILGSLEINGGLLVYIKDSYIQHVYLSAVGDFPTYLAASSSSIGTVTTTSGVMGISFVGDNVLSTAQTLDSSNLDIGVDDYSALQITGTIDLTGNMSSIFIRSNANLTADNFVITAASIENFGSGSSIVLNNGDVNSDIKLENAQLTLGGVQISGSVTASATEINIVDGVNINGNVVGTNSTSLNIVCSSLPSSIYDTIVSITGQPSTISITDGAIQFGIIPNSDGILPYIQSSIPYYIITSPNAFDFTNTNISFSNSTWYDPSFQTIQQNGAYYLTVTFN